MEVEANTKDNAKEKEQVWNVIRPQQSIIGNLAGAVEGGGEGRMSMGAANPHVVEAKHEGNVNGESINEAKRHNPPCAFYMARAKKRQLVHGVISHSNLVKSRPGV